MLVLCNERVPFLGVSSNRGQTLKIALFYKKGTFGRKKGTFGRKGCAHPLHPLHPLDPPMNLRPQIKRCIATFPRSSSNKGGMRVPWIPSDSKSKAVLTAGKTAGEDGWNMAVRASASNGARKKRATVTPPTWDGKNRRSLYYWIREKRHCE
jgi:hypothetical protein